MNEFASPKSEFGYDDAYSLGDEFVEVNIRKPKRRQTIFKKTPKKLCQLSEMKKISMNVPKSSRFVVKQKKMLSSTCDISEAGKKTVTKSLTTPISPNFRIDKRMQLSKQQLSTEEILMKRLETEKQEEAEKSQKAKKLYLRIKMQSDRLKLKNKQSESNDVTTNCTKSKKIFLRPKVLSYYKENASTKTLDNCTAAEIAMNFLHNTRSNGAPQNAAQKITLPLSPKLRTKRRGEFTMTQSNKTYEERLEEEMKQIKANPFKAKPVNKRIFESNGELGVPKVEAKKSTEPIAFNLRGDQRKKNNGNKSSSFNDKPDMTNFKARPLPAYFLDPSKTPQLPVPSCKSNFKPTLAQSPKLHGGKSASLAPERRQRERVSKTTISVNEKLNKSKDTLKLTEPKEFHLSTTSRGEYYRQQLNQQIVENEKKVLAATIIHATPMPKFSKIGFRPDLKSTKIPVTEQKPFKLRSEIRHTDALQAFKRDISVIESELAQQTTFHALKIPQTTYKPENMTVTESAIKHELVIPLEIKLETDKRAIKRHEFDQQVEQKMSQVEAMQEILAKQKLDMENRRIKDMRKKSIEEGGMSFKAQPILSKDPFPTTQPQSIALTTPFSPQLRTKARSSFRNNVNSNVNIQKSSDNSTKTTSTVSKLNVSSQNTPNSIKFAEAIQTL